MLCIVRVGIIGCRAYVTVATSNAKTFEGREEVLYELGPPPCGQAGEPRAQWEALGRHQLSGLDTTTTESLNGMRVGLRDLDRALIKFHEVPNEGLVAKAPTPWPGTQLARNELGIELQRFGGQLE